MMTVLPGKSVASRVRYGVALCAALLTIETFWSCASRAPHAPPPPQIAASAPTPESRAFTATAYSVKGTTASGGSSHRGVVAADPDVLPIGTRIRVRDAGAYSGTYTVTDTGRKVKGEKIDLYIPNAAEARRFGKRTVRVEMVSEASEK